MEAIHGFICGLMSGSVSLSSAKNSKMLNSRSLQPGLNLSPALRRRQKSHLDSLSAHCRWIETTPRFRAIPSRHEMMFLPAKLYARKMKRFLKSKKLAEAKDLYIETALKGDEPGLIIGSILIDSLMKSGLVSDAFQVFDAMPDRNIVTWASMILGCARNSHEQEGLYLFIDMLESGVALNDYACNAALRACAKLCSSALGEQVHSMILRSGFFRDRRILNCLIEFYSRRGLMHRAARVFNGIRELDMVSYTSMISGFCRNNCTDSAVELFHQMVKLGLQPNERAVASILTACNFQLGCQIHGYMIKSTTDQSVFSTSSLIEFYSRHCNIKHAEQVFKKLKNRNVVAWSSMISCFLKHGSSENALRLFVGMVCEGFIPNEVTFTTAIRASGLCSDLGSTDLGLQLHASVIKQNMVSDRPILNALLTMYADLGKVEEFDKVLDKSEDPDIVSWCAAISGYFQNGFYERSAGLLCEVHGKGMKPNEYGFSSALSSCANIPLANQGRQFHCLALKSGCDQDLCVGNALINLYAKCGYLDDARSAFYAMHAHDILSWNSLIHGYANHGFGRKSLQLFDEMVECESCLPDRSTFLGLLVGCNHMGFTDDAIEIFRVMDECYALAPSPSHYACMVDILGRAGNISEAIRVIEEMPYESDVMVWKSLLGSCRIHGNLELGKLAAERVIELSPNDSAGYVLLSNLYSMHAEWEDAGAVRSIMAEKGVQKDAGWSWIELSNEVIAFHAGGELHEKAEMIDQVLKELSGIIKVGS